MTILGDDPFVVTDALADARFAGSPLARGGVRFYAGAPAVDPASGNRLGAICIAHTEARRSLDDGECRMLAGFARVATTALQRRRDRVAAEGDRRGPKIAAA